MRSFLSLFLAIVPFCYARWGGGTLQSDHPLMVVYLENWAGWQREYYVSDLEKYILSRNMPVRNWVVNYAFLTWNAGECRIVPVDTEIDFSKGDPNLYSTAPIWWSPGVTSYSSGSIPALLSLKQKYPHIKLIPSIGGWSRSHSFHQCLLSKPDVMVQSSVDVINSFGFDGIDFDWEYPNCDGPGAKCGCQGEETCPNTPNMAGPGDWERYKLFVERLRNALDYLEDKLQKRLYITAALGVNPSVIDGENEVYSVGTPYEWICGADAFDWVNLMTYDYYGPWSAKTGPLAPLFLTPDSIAAEGAKQMSIDDSVKRILSRCSRPEKLTMGLPAYGKLWKSVPGGRGSVPGLWSTSSESRNPAAFGTWEAGTASFWDIKQNLESSSFCEKTFDDYSKTATLYCERNPKLNSETNVFVSYDDGRAWSEKMAYARSHGFAGGIIWAASDIGKLSPDYSGELFGGAFEGWFGETQIIDPPYSNGKRDFQIPEPWDNFPCPIPYGTNAASMTPVPNPCYGTSVNVTIYHEREPLKMPRTSSVQDPVGKNQKLIHGYDSSSTTGKPDTRVSSSNPITIRPEPTVSHSSGTSGSSQPISVITTRGSSSVPSKTTPRQSSERTESSFRPSTLTPTGTRPLTGVVTTGNQGSSSTSSDAFPIAMCKNYMVSHGKESAIITECGLLCDYYAGSAWCPADSAKNAEVLINCVLSLAPYCHQN